MKRLLLLALIVIPALAQEREQRIFQIKYASARDIANLAGSLVGGASVNINDRLNVIAISAPAGTMKVYEDMIKRLDVPPRNVELTVYYLVASNNANMGGPSVPAELQPVVKQVQSVFNYKQFALMDTASARARTGQGVNTEGIVREVPGIENRSGMQALSYLRIRSVTVSPDDTAPVVRIDGLGVGVRLPAMVAGKWDYLNASVNTEIDVRAGQKVVVGKSNMNAPDQALVLVLTAKVVD
jgi:hypothetical protein